MKKASDLKRVRLTPGWFEKPGLGTIPFDKEVVSEGSALCSKARKGRQGIRKGDIRQETGIRGNERGETRTRTMRDMEKRGNAGA